MTLTYPARPLSLEDEARALGQRWSVTSAEREQIAVDAYALIVKYEAQGGKFSTTWLKQHMGLSQGMAVNVRRAGLALSKAKLHGIGVTRLAMVGRELDRGCTLIQALMLLDSSEARKQAADAAGIGVASVKYSAGLTGDMADAYTSVANTYQQAGVPVPELPELTVSMAKLASRATVADIRNLELGEAIGTQAQKKVRSDIPDFYTWLARQPCAVCNIPGVHLHHLRSPDLHGHAGGRRYQDKAAELLIPLCPRCHQHSPTSAHAGSQQAWSLRHFGSESGAIVLAGRYMAAYLEDHHLLRGN